MAKCGCGLTNTTTCAAIVECIGTNLGPGLEYVDGQIRVHLSTDPGNITTIGGDGGIYTPVDSVGPGEQTWLKTVATLPAQAIEGTGGGIFVGPSTSPYLIEYCVANDVDMYSTTVLIGSDGAAIETVSTFNASVTTYSDNPGPLTWGQSSALTMSQINYDAGTRVNPTGRNSNARADLLVPDGGWAGFYENQYTGRSVSELLRLVRGRMVCDLRIGRGGMTEDQTEATIVATAQAVVDAGAQDWCIININGYLDDLSPAPIADWVPLVTSQGITAAVNLINDASAPVKLTAAAIVASGATWTCIIRDDGINDTVDDARVTELVVAGLQVIARTSSRQYWTDYNFNTLGVRGVEGPDPVYARGGRGLAGDLDYRQTFIPGLETRTVISGAATPLTDNNRAIWEGGFARLDLPGRWFEPSYAWIGGVPRFANNQLLGTISPIPDTANFALHLRIRRQDAANINTARWGGIFWGAMDDLDISHPSGMSNPNRSGYNCAVFEPSGVATRMGIFRHDAGVSTTLVNSTTAPGWLNDEWIELNVTVAGASITFEMVSSGGSTTLNVVDATYRGPYCYFTWNNDIFDTQFRGYDNGTGLVMYEAQS